MDCHDAAPLALLAWIARCRRLGLSDEDLAAEVDLQPAWLEDPRLARIEARLARERAPSRADPAAGPSARLEAAVQQLLAQGRVAEAMRLRHGIELAGRRGARSDRAALPNAEFDLEAELAAADPEFRALWEAYGYESWVVPPGSGRRPLASLTAEWVTPADRWRVLEELRRVDDPAERARVLAHFEKAGLDPGRDHPAFARPEATPSGPTPGVTAAPSSPVTDARSSVVAGPRADHSASSPSSSSAPAPGLQSSWMAGSPAGHDTKEGSLSPSSVMVGRRADHPASSPSSSSAADPGTDATATDGAEPGRDPALLAYLRRLGEEADDYHAAARRRATAEAWRRHARELGVPIPPHARLDDALEPGLEPAPAEPYHAPPPPEPALAWPDGLGPRPSEPVPDWPWPRGDGEPAALAAERAARAPRPAPAGKTSRPRSPPSVSPSTAAGTSADRPRPAPDPVAHPSEALMGDPPGATRVRKRRGRGAASAPSGPATPPRAPAPAAPPAAPTVWAQEPLGPNRLARLRGDHPWWL